ncbi:MAG: diacylglycerol kinase family protein [Erysipelotrichia bacterium]|nr:diacylglycerol kinase family protein [Erysipelotrichia bacterium]
MKLLREKFKPAFNGLLLAFKDGSVRIQLYLCILAITAGTVIQLSHTEWIAVWLCIGLVVVTEIINTAIEKLCNLYTVSQNEQIKIIKDLAAGAVLFAAVISLICAVEILFEHFV